VSKIPKGNPYAGIGPGADPGEYFRSLIPPEPNVTLDIHNKSQRQDFITGFNPDPTLTNRIFSSFYEPNTSFADIAHQHNTTLEALTAWLARPDIAERMANLENACAARMRMVAIGRLHHAIEACTIVLREFADGACHEEGLKQGRGYSPAEHLRRDRENARKTSLLLLRLARFDPTRPRRTDRSPARELRATSGTVPLNISQAAFDTIPFYTFGITGPSLSSSSCAAGSIQNPRGNAGATGATQPTAITTPPSQALAPLTAHSISPEPQKGADPVALGASPRSTWQAPESPGGATEPHHTPPSHAPTAPPMGHATTTAQAEGLTVHNRGVERGSASDTPGKDARISPHPEGVHAANSIADSLNAPDHPHNPNAPP
jgi:hypothetical protein